MSCFGERARGPSAGVRATRRPSPGQQDGDHGPGPPSTRGTRGHASRAGSGCDRVLRRNRGEPVYQDIPAEPGRDGKRIRDRCHRAKPRAARPSGRGELACRGRCRLGPLREAATGGHHRARARRRRRPPVGDRLLGGRAARTVRNSPGSAAAGSPVRGRAVAVERRVPSSTEVPGMQVAMVGPDRGAGGREGVGASS
jgi:hypothetical protein